MGTHGPQRKLEKCFDVILQDETNRDTCLKVIRCSHSTNLINKIVLDQLIKDTRVWIKTFPKCGMDNSNLGSQTSVLKTQKASLHYCTRPAKNVFCTVEWTKTDPRLFDAMICQIHLHSTKIYLNWGLQNSTRPFLCQCSSQCPWVNPNWHDHILSAELLSKNSKKIWRWKLTAIGLIWHLKFVNLR